MKLTPTALREDQIQLIQEKVAQLLEQKGITIKDVDVCTFFQEKGAKVSGEQVHIPREMLQSALSSIPPSFTLHARNPEKTVTIGRGHPPVINTNSGMSFIQDWNHVRRRACVQDQINMLKLAHTSSVIGVSNAGILYPTEDIAPDDALFLQMRNALCYSDKPFFSQGLDGNCAKHAIAMAQIATGYQDRPVCMSVCNSLSPMAWDSKMLAMIRVFAQANQPINISSSAMIGATAPIFLSGALILAVAEALTGIIYAQLIRPGTPVVFGCFSGAMDMQNMSMAYGSPEFALLGAAASQVAAAYKIPFRGGGALADAKVTNMQCGIESAMNMMVALNTETHYMHQSIGTMDAIMTCSAEKFIMDEEIVARIRRMQQGIGEIDDAVMESIEQGLAEHDYLNVESTAENFREQIFIPPVSDRCTYQDWISEERSNEKRAHQIFKQRLGAYVEPDIGSDIKNALKNYASAQGARI